MIYESWGGGWYPDNHNSKNIWHFSITFLERGDKNRYTVKNMRVLKVFKSIKVKLNSFTAEGENRSNKNVNK